MLDTDAWPEGRYPVMFLPTTVHILEPTTTQVERILELLYDKSCEIK